MALDIDKLLIKNRFARSVNTYDEHASIQQLMAEKLAVLLVENSGKHEFNSVLELGAGTGLYTKALLQRASIHSLLCNDLVGEYKPKLEQVISKHPVRFSFIEADIEQALFGDNEFDLITSAATIQWILDLDTLFIRLKKQMKNNAVFAFSSFGEQNLWEIRKVMQSGLFYNSFNIVKSLVEKHFDVLYISQNEETLYFDTPLDVLKHLKYTGVNAIFKTSWTRGDLQRFSEKYTELFATESGVTLTYNPMYIIAKHN